MGDMPWSDNLRQMSEIYSYGNKFCTIIGDKFAKLTKSVIKFSQDLQINSVADSMTYLMTKIYQEFGEITESVKELNWPESHDFVLLLTVLTAHCARLAMSVILIPDLTSTFTSLI